MYKGLKLTSRERKELAISEIALLVLAVIGLAVVIWFAWARPANRTHTVSNYEDCVAAGNPVQESYPSVCVTDDGKRFVNPADKQEVQQQPSSGTSESQQQGNTPTDNQYLTIKEWSVRVPLPVEYNDLKYTYTKGDDGDRASFTFKRLEDAGFCKNDVGVTMVRDTVKHEPPFNIDNPEPAAHVGFYYYYLSYGGSPCFDDGNADQMKLVNEINGGKLIDAVKKTLANLQAS